MRWYEINSEQLDAITDQLIAYRKRLTDSVESAKKAHLVRAYDMDRGYLRDLEKAMSHLGDIYRTES